MISVVTFNVRGIRATKKRRAIFRHLHVNYPDSIISLQETHSSDAVETYWRAEWGGDIYFSHGRENAGGVAFLFPRNTQFNVRVMHSSEDGRLLRLEINSDTCKATIIGVYAPSTSRQEDKCSFLDRLQTQLLAAPNDHLVICGDMNIKLSARDTNSTYIQTRASKVLRNMLTEFDLVDIWRKRFPRARKYTWIKTRPLKQSRLDYIFISKSMYRGKLSQVRIDSGFYSDHSFVFAEIDARKEERGRGIWRFNNLLLEDETFKCSIKGEIEKCIQRNIPYDDDCSKGILVEMLLSNCRVIAIRRSVEIKRQQRREEEELMKKLEELENNLNAEEPNSVRSYEEAKDRLEEIKGRKGEFAMLASGARWMEQGEKPSKYFLSLCRKRTREKSMVYIESEDGSIYCDRKEILAYCTEYYGNMFRARGVEIEKMSIFGLDEDDPKLTREENMKCEGPITKEECIAALKGMARNKAPGITGFTAEFYICFWEQIAGLIEQYICEVFVNKQFFINHVRGIVHLIPKKGDQTRLKNKRPICLVDVLYKMVAKVLAQRLGGCMNKIINRDQTGFVRGRFIGENIRLVSDIIEYCEEEDREGILLTVDFRNAFDTLEREFLIYALKCFNLGEDFCTWMQTLYQGAQLCVINDGCITDWFPCERGTFQGSPISGMLFVLAIELLANKIRRSSEIRGISINGVEVKISLYADDMTLFLRNTESMEKCLSILRDFGTASGLEMNVSKTKMMWLGRDKNKSESFFQIEAVEKVKILGIYFSAKTSCYRENIDKVIGNITQVTNAWSQRNLTIKGRITIAKSLILSQIVYIASSCPIESSDLTTIQSHIMRFLWRGRPPKVAKNVMWQDIRKGGLNAPCVEAMVKALGVAWVRRMYMTPDSTWRRLIQARIGEFDLDDLLRMRKSQFVLKQWKIPRFYKIAITDFQNINEQEIATRRDVRKVIIWNNDEICIDNKPVFHKQLYRAGVKYTADFAKSNGELMSFEDFRHKYPQIQINPLTYQGLLCAIPGAWKQLLKCKDRGMMANEEDIQVCLRGKQMSLRLLKAKHCYRVFIEARKPTAELRWEREGYRFSNWDKIYLVPYQCTASTRLQSLHFRIIHRYIPTMKFLHIRHVVNSPRCARCGAIENVSHFLYHCQDVHSIWTVILPKLKQKLCLGNDFISCKSVVFGYPKAKPVVNLVILLIKQYILTCKAKEARNEVRMEGAKRYILQYFRTEQHISKLSLTSDAFQTKWEDVLGVDGGLALETFT